MTRINYRCFLNKIKFISKYLKKKNILFHFDDYLTSSIGHNELHHIMDTSENIIGYCFYTEQTTEKIITQLLQKKPIKITLQWDVIYDSKYIKKTFFLNIRNIFNKFDFIVKLPKNNNEVINLIK